MIQQLEELCYSQTQKEGEKRETSKHPKLVNNQADCEWNVQFSLHRPTEQTALLPDQGNHQPSWSAKCNCGQLNSRDCPHLSAFSTTKMPIFLLSESPQSFTNLLSQKFAQMKVTAGHFNMKIALVVLLEVGNVKSIPPGYACSHFESFLRKGRAKEAASLNLLVMTQTTDMKLR